MRANSFRNWVFFILLVAIAIRVGFLLSGRVLPVMWDARRYVAGAVALISYVDHSFDKKIRNDSDDRKAFAKYTDKYIQGEQIDWLYYAPHTLSQARDELYFSGPLYPLMLSAIFYVSPVADFTVARALGVLLDILSCMLIIAIGVRLVGKSAALVAGFFYAIYFPFVLASTMLLLETSTTFWLLLAVFFILRGYEENSKFFYVASGVVTGLLILNKPTAMLLAVPIAIGFFFYARGKLPGHLLINRLVFFILPVAVIFIGWTAAASVKYGQFTLRDPSYGDANLRQSSNIMYEGYDLDKVEGDFWTYSLSDEILEHPIGYLGLVVKKFERLWSRPFNDFKRNFILPYKGIEYLHRFLMITGLLGMLLLLVSDFRNGIWVLLLAGYYSGIHTIFHSISRYSFSAIPFVLLAGAYFLVAIYARYKISKRRPRLVLLAVVVWLIFIGLLNMKLMNAVFTTGIRENAVGLFFVVKYVVIAILLWALIRVLMGKADKGRSILVAVVASLVLAGVSWSRELSRDGWAEFPARLSESTLQAGTRIYISKPPVLGDSDMVAVAVDMTSGKDRKNTFTLSALGWSQDFVEGKPPLSDLFYPKPTYRYYAQFENMGIEQFRQYVIVPVPDSLVNARLAENGYIDISVAINHKFNEPDNYVTLYGNYATKDSLHYIPAFRFTSVERYVDKGDPRIRYPVKFLSDSTISYYIARDSKDIPRDADLSGSPGIQTGRFNMFLVQFRPDGSFAVY